MPRVAPAVRRSGAVADRATFVQQPRTVTRAAAKEAKTATPAKKVDENNLSARWVSLHGGAYNMLRGSCKVGADRGLGGRREGEHPGCSREQGGGGVAYPYYVAMLEVDC
eukprot:364612-Chlamydomonas_euryale.AAC.13